MFLEHICDQRRVVRLHVVHHKIIDLSATEHFVNVSKVLFLEAALDGIDKGNIFTDLCLAGLAGQEEALKKGLDYLSARNLKKDYIAASVERKIELFGCAGKA